LEISFIIFYEIVGKKIKKKAADNNGYNGNSGYAPLLRLAETVKPKLLTSPPAPENTELPSLHLHCRFYQT